MKLETVVQDIVIGVRVLVKERAFCALAVFVLALGVAAVTTQFTVVNAVMLRGFSFPNAGRLFDVRFIDPTSASFFGANNQVRAMDFEEFRTEQQSFEMMAAYLSGSTVNVTNEGTPRRYTGAYITEDFLRVLGVGPMLGRDFVADDNKPGAPKVALLSYGIWQRDFGGATDIVGRNVRINGAPATIIGVMPASFNFPVNEDLWIPLYSEFPVRARNDPRQNDPAVLGLIRAGVPVKQAEAEMTRFAARFAQAYPDTNKQFTAAQVQPLLSTFTPLPLRGTLLTMLAFCGGVLLISCVNVMNMQFARAMLRVRELAVRSSLGATRSRLIRQMLTESLLLAGAGALLGIVLAYGADALITPLRRAITRLDPNLPLYFVGTPKENTAGFIAPSRIIATMFTIFGAIAVVLAAVGIYGVMSFSVNRRTSEFGVRMALGAQHREILRMVLTQGARQVGLGLFLGLGLALTLATIGGTAIGNTLFNVSARDPLTYMVVVLLIALVSLAAVIVPGRRAASVDPLIALRAE